MGMINCDVGKVVKLPRPGGSGGAGVEVSKGGDVGKVGTAGKCVDGLGKVLGAVVGLALLGAFDDGGGVDFSPP